MSEGSDDGAGEGNELATSVEVSSLATPRDETRRGDLTSARHVQHLGAWVLLNLVTCCAQCNSLKRDMDAEVYAHYLRNGHGWTAEEARDLRRRVRNALRRKLPE